ncbi:MAG: NDP-sugar synthase [Candidatus Margulisbacteria bacterium]|nr:NDP-sugar synthase [Candidatus Margulisiibacteriota bacterium]
MTKKGKIKALIMAAGYGTRLEPLTLAVPKPMVPIVNKPTMLHNLELLKKHGIRDIIANIHYHPEQIQNYFGDGEKFGVSLHYSYEEKLLGTAGGVRRMARLVDNIDSTFIVLSSDALTDINLPRMIAFHKKNKALATIALYPVKDTSQFGVVLMDKKKKIIGFQEKPKKGEAKSNLVNAGIYILEPEVLDLIPQDKFFDFGHQVFPELVASQSAFYGFEMKGFWSDVGSLEQYIYANYEALRGRVNVQVPGKKLKARVRIGRNCQVHSGVRIEGDVIIGDRCVVRSGAILKNAIVGNMSVIGQGVHLDGSIIWSDTFISHNARISGSVIGNWCLIGESVAVGPNSVIGNRCLVRPGTEIKAATLLKPNEIV